MDILILYKVILFSTLTPLSTYLWVSVALKMVPLTYPIVWS